MKFSELPPGARFRFEGRTYTKTGPVTARDEIDGRLRMIPRYARLLPVQEERAAAEAAGSSEAVSAARLLAAFERFHAVCLELMEAERPEARARLAAARRRFLEECGLRPD